MKNFMNFQFAVSQTPSGADGKIVISSSIRSLAISLSNLKEAASPRRQSPLEVEAILKYLSLVQSTISPLEELGEP